MNTCLQRAYVPEWMSKGRSALIKKYPNKRNRSKQLQTRNLPNDDVENINRTNKTFTTRQQALDCSLRNRIDAAKEQEA